MKPSGASSAAACRPNARSFPRHLSLFLSEHKTLSARARPHRPTERGRISRSGAGKLASSSMWPWRRSGCSVAAAFPSFCGFLRLVHSPRLVRARAFSRSQRARALSLSSARSSRAPARRAWTWRCAAARACAAPPARASSSFPHGVCLRKRERETLLFGGVGGPR